MVRQPLVLLPHWSISLSTSGVEQMERRRSRKKGTEMQKKKKPPQKKTSRERENKKLCTVCPQVVPAAYMANGPPLHFAFYYPPSSPFFCTSLFCLFPPRLAIALFIAVFFPGSVAALAAAVTHAEEAIQQIAPLMNQLNHMLPEEHRLEPLGTAQAK